MATFRRLRLLACLVGLVGATALRVPPRPHFDPLNLYSQTGRPGPSLPASRQPERQARRGAALAVPAVSAALLTAPASALADVLGAVDIKPYEAVLDPRNFVPVCPASDGFYRFGQTLVVGLVGGDNYKEYAPLIAGGLLRVRLELCVVESFVYEAIIPFIKDKGLSWVLPLHETVETFLAGVIFAVASNFILIGSTKLVTVIFTYGDFFVGFPLRVVGGIGWRALEEKAMPDPPPKEDDDEVGGFKGLLRALFRKPVEVVRPSIDEVIEANVDSPKEIASLALWGSLRATGELSGGVRRAIETLDVFVGRYLLLTTVGYVGIKFVHYKLFDPFP